MYDVSMNALSPTADAFTTAYASGRGQIVWTRIVADLETPVSAWLKLGAGETHSFLFESVQGGETRGRYSIIGLKPDLIWRVTGDTAEICRNPGDAKPVWTPETLAPLQSLKAQLDAIALDIPTELPPMVAGLFGYLAYDMVRQMERLPKAKPDPIGVHDAILVRPTIMAIFDALKADVTLASPVWPEPGLDAATAYRRAVARIDAAKNAFFNPLPQSTTVKATDVGAVVSNTTHANYLDMVSKAKEYIGAGDA